MRRKYDLEERLIAFGQRMTEIAQTLPHTQSGKNISGQLVRSGTSAAFNYGETQAAESRKDFIHKLGVVLKELKECRVGLKTIQRSQMITDAEKLNPDVQENEELVAIIGKSISTAKKNGKDKGQDSSGEN